MGLADRRAIRDRTLGVALDEHATLASALAALEAEARATLAAQGVDEAAIRTEARVELRHARAEYGIEIALGTPDAMRGAFEAAHRERFGFVGDDALIVELLRVEAIADAAAPVAALVTPPLSTAPPLATVDAWLAGASHPVPLHDRAGLAAGAIVTGPALIVDPVATTVVEPGWTAAIDPERTLILTRQTPRPPQTTEGAVDPVRLEIFAGLFMGLAEEMGAALQRSASSVNIRERLDFSCALFDGEGGLVANAPHIPVHLGSMSAAIRAVIAARTADARGIRPGDVYASNDPYRGGTHLPDITVIMPVFAGGPSPAFYVAARGHHADIGGISPGSMPPDSRAIADEGVILDDVLLVEDGRMRTAELRALLSSGPWPSRDVDRNIADLTAQVAACARGADGLTRMVADYGLATVSGYMEHLQDHAAAAVRALLAELPEGAFAYETDDGAVIRVAVRIDRIRGTATVDFAGSSDQRPTNFNAPLSVTRAAVLYVMRVLVGATIPMNDGFLRPVTVIVPEGSMLNPRFPAAIVAGNVETSQVVTDALFGALGGMAGSQGTMNNFTFGDDAHQYYETIAGGAGAGPGFMGASVVQTHMTNSRLTDPEVFETRFPVLLEEFSVRPGSGGAGRYPGGEGATRRVRFRRAMRANILSDRRRVPPFGLAGGESGGLGATYVERADGSVEHLPATAAVDMEPGDVFVIETPGGGGYGEAG
jgi:5-oxoprolinase (ATP-hydrolysing)